MLTCVRCAGHLGTPAGHVTPPDPGDVACCPRCFAVLEFVDANTLALLDESEVEKLPRELRDSVLRIRSRYVVTSLAIALALADDTDDEPEETVH